MENNEIPNKTTVQNPLRDELQAKIDKQTWIFAKTYADKAPHEYFTVFKNPELFKTLSEAITKYGENSLFRLEGSVKKYKCLYLGDYSYWRIGIILNRSKLSDVRFVDGAYEPNLPKK